MKLKDSNKVDPKLVFFFAGQSSPQLSFKRKKKHFKAIILGVKMY